MSSIQIETSPTAENQVGRELWSGYLFLLIFSFITSLFLFFSDPYLHLIFDGNTAYSDFSSNIFRPNTSYFAESILLPLLAKTLGAHSSLAAYKILCSVLTIFILPIVSVAAYKYYNNISTAVFYTLILAVAFPWFRMAGIGQPDPPTILFLLLSALQKNPKPLFVCLFLASLSHFSLVLFAVPTLFLFIHATESLSAYQKKKLYKALLFSVLCGKLFLSLWYFIFDYQLSTRLNWIIERGSEFFVDRYKTDPIGFWTTPNTFFLCLFSGLSIWFCFLRKFRFSFAMWSGLAAAYTANFITIDGYRITAVILAAPLAFSIREALLVYQRPVNIILEKLKIFLCFVTIALKNYWLDTTCLVTITGFWAYALTLAAKRGLLINGTDSFMISGNFVEPINAFIMVSSVFIAIVFSIKKYRQSFLGRMATLLFMAPFPLIALQYFRRLFFFNQPLSVLGNVLAVGFLGVSLLLLFRLDGIFIRIFLKARVLLRRIASY